MKNPGIYILTNSVNGKQYVGRDSNLPNRANLHLRGQGRSPGIHAAIKKYGRENFTVEIIRFPHISHQILCWFERSYIAELDTFRNGYNQTLGGDGGLSGYKHTTESRRKMSENNPMKKPEIREKWKKNTFTPESQEKRRQWTVKNNPMNCPLTRKKHDKAMKDPERSEKLSKAHTGKKLTESHKENIAKGRRLHYAKKRGQLLLFD